MFPLPSTHLDLLTARAPADPVPHPRPSYFRELDDETNEELETLIREERLAATYRLYTGVRSTAKFVVLIFPTAYTKPLKLIEADMFLRAYALGQGESR